MQLVVADSGSWGKFAIARNVVKQDFDIAQIAVEVRGFEKKVSESFLVAMTEIHQLCYLRIQ